ncbi:MAG: DUF2442 domain-containing protein [Chloroflexota bacterium]|jgi:hypothetical protein
MHKVKQATPLSEYKLKILFTNDVEKIVDIKPFIGKGISTALHDQDFFHQVAIDSSGGIFWPNGYDFCPNFLYKDVPEVDLLPV